MAQPFNKFKKYFKRKPAIQDILRETTAGGVVFRRNKKGEIEILLAQDAKDRWTIPKGHIEPEETPEEKPDEQPITTEATVPDETNSTKITRIQ